MTLRDWRDGVLLGTALGAIVLGVGGRIAMRLAALAVEQEPEFTVGGSATVMGAGAIAGAGAAILFLVIGVIPLLGQTGKALAFWVGSLAIALAIL
jgi:hypothetical protein